MSNPIASEIRAIAERFSAAAGLDPVLRSLVNELTAKVNELDAIQSSPLPGHAHEILPPGVEASVATEVPVGSSVQMSPEALSGTRPRSGKTDPPLKGVRR